MIQYFSGALDKKNEMGIKGYFLKNALFISCNITWDFGFGCLDLQLPDQRTGIFIASALRQVLSLSSIWHGKKWLPVNAYNR